MLRTLLLALLLASGCIGELDVFDRPCPCAEEWVCCPGKNVCAPNIDDCGVVDGSGGMGGWGGMGGMGGSGVLDKCIGDPPAAGPTVAPAVIDQDTVWRAEQSPITLQSDSVVLTGVALTVCAGTRMEAIAGAEVTLHVRGNLDIHGTELEPVVITSAAPYPAPGDWAGIVLDPYYEGRLVIRSAVVEYAAVAIAANGVADSGEFSIEASVFQYNDVALLGTGQPWGATITNSQFLDNRCVIEDAIEAVFSDSVFRRNQGINCHGGGMSFIRCTIADNASGINTTGEIVEGCLIQNNTGFGLVAAYHQTVRNSTIVDNGSGITIVGLDPVTITNNTLCGNTAYDLKVESENDFDVTNNWWCSINEVNIATRIYDVYDDPVVGLAEFVPFLTEAPPDAPEP